MTVVRECLISNGQDQVLLPYRGDERTLKKRLFRSVRTCMSIETPTKKNTKVL